MTNVTVASPAPASALTPVGAPGTVAGVVLVADDANELPEAFVAVTVKMYAVPFVRPTTVHEVAGGVAVHVEPFEAVTV